MICLSEVKEEFCGAENVFFYIRKKFIIGRFVNNNGFGITCSMKP